MQRQNLIQSVNDILDSTLTCNDGQIIKSDAADQIVDMIIGYVAKLSKQADVAMPAIPTEFTTEQVVNGRLMEAGWYGVKMSNIGLECLRGTETRHKDFDTCKRACDIHNKTACGMSELQIAQLYVQQRGEIFHICIPSDYKS